MGRAVCRFLQRNIERTSTSTRAPPRPPRASSACCQVGGPQAFASRSPTGGFGLPQNAVNAPCATRRRSTVSSGFARDRRRSVSGASAEVQPRTGCPEVKGSQPFGLFASSPPSKAAEHPLVTDPLPRKPGELPPRFAWSIAPSFPGGEGPRSATRTGQDFRSDAFPRRPTFSRKPGCFLPIVAARAGGSPLCLRRSVSPSRRP